MFKIPLLRWRHWLPFALFLLCAGLNAQPIYNKKNVTQKLPTYFNGQQDVRLMEYTTTPNGQDKEYRLELLPEKGLPAVEMKVVTGAIKKKAVYITEKNGNASFNDDQPNPFSVATSAGLLWSLRETMITFQKYFGWNGLNNAGQVISVELGEEEKEYAAFIIDDNKIQVLGNAGLFIPDVSVGTICHEFTHGVFHHRAFDSGTYTNEFLAISESFADIFSVFVRKEVEKAATYNWIFGDAAKAGGFRNFENPNLNLHPDTYRGTFWQEWDDPKFNPHINASLINHCFYHLAQGSNGPKKNFHGTSYDCVGIGVPKAIEIFWGAMDGLTTESTFFDLRKRTLEVVHKMGHPTGSALDLAVREAWKSVGLGQELVVTDLECETGKTAQSLFYGTVPINTANAFVVGDAQAGKINILVDCMEEPHIRTAISDPTAAIHFIDTNDADQIYTLDNDVTLSKQGVSVHFATRLVNDYFQSHHNFSGLDGKGNLEIWNYVGDPDPKLPHGYNKIVNFFKYNNNNNALSIDQITATYFKGIYDVVKNPPPSLLAEADAISFALGDIFGFEVNKIYRKSKGEEPVWTIGSDVFNGADYLRSFSDPTTKGQLKFYNGQGSAGATPEQMAGVWTQFYYLISNGTSLNGFTNENGQTRFFLKLDEGAPEKIMFDAFRKFLPSLPTFDDMANAIQSSLVANGYTQNSSSWKTCMDALTCVLGKEYIEPPKLWAIDADGNEVKKIDALNAQFRSDIYNAGKEGNRLFEVSENSQFNEAISPVYRAFRHTSETILPYINEQNPGKQTSTAKFFLEGSKTYYVRSRLCSADGPGCVSSIGGAPKCRDLEKMVNNWSTTLEVTTLPIVTDPVGPLENDEIDAWGSKFSWQATPGAEGYIMRITDLTGAVPVQDVPFKATSDESESLDVALAKERDYSWQIVATHKLGSEEGVTWDKPSKTLIQTGFTDIDVFGDWTQKTSFKTTIPETPLRVPPGPADGEHVPPFGEDILLSAEEVPGASGYRYHIQDKKDDRDFPEVLYDHESLKLPDVSDGKVYTWAFEPYKDITPPFITEQEFGKKHFSTFVVDYSLVPTPVLTSPENNAVLTFQEQASENFGWQAVAGADEYDYSVSRTFDDAILAWADGSTAQTNVTIDHVEDLPDDINGGFKWRVRAKAKDEKGDWIYGPYSEPFFYWLRPAKSNLIYPGENVQIDEVAKVDFAWGDQWAPDGFLFRLFKDGEPIFEKPVKGTSITLANLEWGGAYAWDAPAMNITPIGTHFPEPYTFRHFTTKDGANTGDKEVKEYDPNEPEEEPTDPNDPNNPNNPNQPQDPELGKCPGFFKISVTNGQHLDFTLTSHAVGAPQQTYGFQNLDTGEIFESACDNCYAIPATVYDENDEIVVNAKILSLETEWADIPAFPNDETPIISITDPNGKVLGSIKMSFLNWFEGKEIYIGTYKCSDYK